MRRVIFVGGGLLLVALLLATGGVQIAGAQEGGPPDAHAAITEYTGPESCAMCHPATAQEVVESLHYQQQGPVPYRVGWPEGELGGMYVTY
jgi:hypothetical protein